MRNSNQRLMRWSWKLQELSPYIQYVKGRDNVADFLSRKPCVDETSVDREPEYMFPPGYTAKVSQTRNRLNLRLKCQIDRSRLIAEQREAGNDFVAEHSSDDVVKLNDVTRSRSDICFP
jgi:hypothetical protein